jgi:hypothetical protein
MYGIVGLSLHLKVIISKELGLLFLSCTSTHIFGTFSMSLNDNGNAKRK